MKVSFMLKLESSTVLSLAWKISLRSTSSPESIACCLLQFIDTSLVGDPWRLKLCIRLVRRYFRTVCTIISVPDQLLTRCE